MDNCRLCGKYRETSETLTIDESTGNSVKMDLCGECAFKMAAVVVAHGGKVHVITESPKKSSGGRAGCLLAFCIMLAMIVLGYLQIA